MSIRGVISTGSFSSLPTGAALELARGCKGGGAVAFHPVPWFGSAGGFGGEFWRLAGNVSSSQAAGWWGAGRSPAGAAAVRHGGESGAALAWNVFRLIPARLDARFLSPVHRLEELAHGLFPSMPRNPPPAALTTPQPNPLRIPAPAKPRIPTKPFGLGFAGL